MGRKSNAPERKEQILKALFECLAERNYEKITIKGVAEKAGFVAGAIHYYFKSKDEMILMLAESLVETYFNKLDHRLGECSADQERFNVITEFMVEQIFNRPLNRVLYSMIQMSFEKKDLYKVIQKLFDDYRAKVVEVLEETTNCKKEMIPHMAATLVGQAEGLGVQVMVDPDALKKENVTIMVEKFLNDLPRQA